LVLDLFRDKAKLKIKIELQSFPYEDYPGAGIVCWNKAYNDKKDNCTPGVEDFYIIDPKWTLQKTEVHYFTFDNLKIVHLVVALVSIAAKNGAK